MEAQAQTQKHWLAYWWPALAIFGGVPLLALMFGAASAHDRRAAEDVSIATSRADADHSMAKRLAAMPCNKLAESDSEWAGFKAKDSLAFSLALATLDPFCVENQEQIAYATIAAQKRLGEQGFRTSAFDIMDTIYRQTQTLRIGWSYRALVDDYVEGYARYDADRAADAIPRLLRYPAASKP